MSIYMDGIHRKLRMAGTPRGHPVQSLLKTGPPLPNSSQTKLQSSTEPLGNQAFAYKTGKDGLNYTNKKVYV